MANKNVVIPEPTLLTLDFVNFNLDDPSGPRVSVHYKPDPGGVTLVQSDFTVGQRADIQTALNHVLTAFKAKKGGY